MTIYEFNVITTTGIPYYGLNINDIPDGVRIFLRFFDFSKEKCIDDVIDPDSKVELTAGLISAIFEFSRAIDRKIYMLEFQSEGENPVNIDNTLDGPISDTLITCASETYLNQQAIRKKIEFIYKTLIEPKTPLVTSDELITPEVDMIKSILNDNTAKIHLQNHLEPISNEAEKYLIEMSPYGLEGICILSFDLSLIKVFGNKFSFNDVIGILRNMSQVPDIPDFGVKHRIVNYKGEEIWLYLINSGVGITEKYINEELSENYHYLIISKSKGDLGDLIKKLMDGFNDILKF